MNTAIQGAHDLAWKLAWVLRGWAAPALLDSYETEFRPTAEHNVVRSADPPAAAAASEVELHVDLGARIPHPLRASRACPARRAPMEHLGGTVAVLSPLSFSWRDHTVVLPSLHR